MNYHNITTDDMLNGDGLRTVLWVSGCSCFCHNCQNQQTWDFNSGIPFTKDTMQELLDDLSKPYIAGLTLSGGHPLEQQNIDTVYRIIRTIRNEYPNKSIWLYTGYKWEEIIKTDKYYKALETSPTPFDIVKMCDVLVDGKYEDDKRDISLAWRGSTNQHVVDVKESLRQNKIVLYCE